MPTRHFLCISENRWTPLVLLRIILLLKEALVSSLLLLLLLVLLLLLFGLNLVNQNNRSR